MQREQSYWLPSLVRHVRHPLRQNSPPSPAWLVAGTIMLGVLGLDLWLGGEALVPLLYTVPIWLLARRNQEGALAGSSLCSLLTIVAHTGAFALPLKWGSAGIRILPLAAIWFVGWYALASPSHGRAFASASSPPPRRLRESRRQQSPLNRTGRNRETPGVVEAREDERHRIARELHDDLGQRLTALSLQLEVGIRSSAENQRLCLTNAQTQIRNLMVQVRGIAMDLRPAMLDDLGLVPALRWQYQRYTEQTGIEVVSQLSVKDDRRFSPEIEITLFRLVQEALTNVARHAHVNQVKVKVWEENGVLAAEVRDQGAGFDSQAVTAHGPTFGLSGMRERASLVGGDLAVESRIGRGTCMRALLPLDEPAAD